MSDPDLEHVTELILRGRSGDHGRPGQSGADPVDAPLFVGTVLSQTGTITPTWQVADVESPTVSVTVRGYVRLLVESAEEGPRTLRTGTLVLAVERSGEYLILGSPGLYQ